MRREAGDGWGAGGAGGEQWALVGEAAGGGLEGALMCTCIETGIRRDSQSFEVLRVNGCWLCCHVIVFYFVVRAVKLHENPEIETES